VTSSSAQAREEGRDWPSAAETMIGLKRLDNLQDCVADVLRKRVPGDLIEAGVWRGGSTIFMRAMLQAYGVNDRNVWVADSFQGLPKPDEKSYPADKGDVLWTNKELAVSVDEVKVYFQRYGVLDDRVKFLVGWFKDTLPQNPIDSLAILRIDADMYQSTMEALQYLYPKLSLGGYCIIDDYGAGPACKKAVDDFRRTRHINEEIKQIDWSGVYWRRDR
jgi:O-methyltransferase